MTYLKKIESIQFEFGNIPVGLNELIALYPLLLGVEFIICISLFCELVRIRSKITDKDKATIFAPLWIDKYDPVGIRVFRFLILISPMILFIANVPLIIYSWNISSYAGMEDIFTGDRNLNIILYSGL